jgi:hypothetical protein
VLKFEKEHKNGNEDFDRLHGMALRHKEDEGINSSSAGKG